MDGSSPDRGSVSICFVEEALACIRDRGLDANALLIQARISPELLSSPTARVSPRHFGALWQLIAQTIDDEFFGMDTHRMKAGSFTMLCHAIIHSDTLERALLRATRFLHLVLDDLSGELSQDAESAHIVLKDRRPAHSSAPAPAASRAFAYGTYMVILHGLACWLVGRRIPISGASFCCQAPRYVDEWRILFSQRLQFNQDLCRISFPVEYLALPNLQNERTMKEFLRSAPANFLVKYKNSASLAARIRRLLRDGPRPHGPISTPWRASSMPHLPPCGGACATKANRIAPSLMNCAATLPSRCWAKPASAWPRSAASWDFPRAAPSIGPSENGPEPAPANTDGTAPSRLPHFDHHPRPTTGKREPAVALDAGPAASSAPSCCHLDGTCPITRNTPSSSTTWSTPIKSWASIMSDVPAEKVLQ